MGGFDPLQPAASRTEASGVTAPASIPGRLASPWAEPSPDSGMCWNACDHGGAPMNLLLLLPDEFAPDGTARLTGARLRHLREVLGVGPGSTVRTGVLGGRVGTAEVLA